MDISSSQPISRSDFKFAPFLVRSDSRASWQLLITILPIVFLWFLVPKIVYSQFPYLIKFFELISVIGLLVLFSLRTFSLMHDCGHGVLFRSRMLNRIAGFLLGCLNAIPQHPWSRGHAYHHRHNGNWELYRGPSALITLKDYKELSKINKLLYAISRHPLMLFPGGFFYLVIKPRLSLILGSIEFLWMIFTDLKSDISKKDLPSFTTIISRVRNHKSSHWFTSGELADLIGNNLIVIISWFLMSYWLGSFLFWVCYSAVMTISAAIFICIFFVQHNFDGSYANASDDWSSLRGALEGTSNLDVPDLLNWFFADISFHSIHHLCDKIPNYNLRSCHETNKHLLIGAKTLRLVDIPNCFKYILWDSQTRQLTTL